MAGNGHWARLVYWTLLCGEHLVRHGEEKKENEVLLDLSSKSLQSFSGAESICSARITVNGERVPYKLLRGHQWVLEEEQAKSCKDQHSLSKELWPSEKQFHKEMQDVSSPAAIYSPVGEARDTEVKVETEYKAVLPVITCQGSEKDKNSLNLRERRDG